MWCDVYLVDDVTCFEAIHHLKPVQSGDTLEARATLLNETRRTGLYQIDIFKDDVRVAFFKGTVYRTGNEWNL